MRQGSRSLPLAGAVAVAFLITGCVPAVVGGGLFVVGVGSALLFSGCGEPAQVQVWDHTSSHPVCDATVTAVSEKGHEATFSPCYQAYLGAGTWTVTASRPGLPVATGTITVAADHKCSQPTFHSLDLTLGSDGTVPTMPPPAAPRAPIPPPPIPPLPPAPADTGVTPMTAPMAPSPAPPSAVPSAAFPAQSTPAPPATEVPAPPTR